MDGKSIATFIAVICGAGLGLLGSCIASPEAKAPQAAHVDATRSPEHQALLDVVIRQRTPPQSRAARAGLRAGLGQEGNGSSPRQGG